MNKAMGVGEVINSLGVPPGYQKELLGFLIQSEDDYKKFVHEFYTGEIIRDIANFQSYKREQNRMLLNEFLSLFKEDKKKVLENLFQEPMSNRYVEYLDVYNVTPQSLYTRYTKDSNRSYLSLVKQTNEYTKDYSENFLLTT